MICARAEDAATTGRTIAARTEKIPLYFRIDTLLNCWFRHPKAHRLHRGYFGYFSSCSDQERAMLSPRSVGTLQSRNFSHPRRTQCRKVRQKVRKEKIVRHFTLISCM